MNRFVKMRQRGALHSLKRVHVCIGKIRNPDSDNVSDELFAEPCYRFLVMFVSTSAWDTFSLFLAPMLILFLSGLSVIPVSHVIPRISAERAWRDAQRATSWSRRAAPVAVT